jgi:hypothetical protein
MVEVVEHIVDQPLGIPAGLVQAGSFGLTLVRPNIDGFEITARYMALISAGTKLT